MLFTHCRHMNTFTCCCEISVLFSIAVNDWFAFLHQTSSGLFYFSLPKIGFTSISFVKALGVI